MTSEPRAFLALDAGAATTVAALIGRVGSRWRLVGSLAMPAGADTEGVISVLGDRAIAADPGLASALDLRRGRARDLPRLEVASHTPRKMAVVAASERVLGPLLATASRSGWRTVSGSAETTDPLAMSAMLLDKSVTGVLVGAGDPPSADERRALGELAALIAAAAGRRPELTVILAGGMAEHLAAFGDVGTRPGEVVLGPAAQRGSPAGPLSDRPCRALAAAPRRSTWRSSRPRGWHRPSPTTRSSIGWGSGRPGAPTGTACATGCASCGSRRGRTRRGKA